MYEAFNRCDWNALFADADPEVEWAPLEENVSYRGRAAIIEYFDRWLAGWVDFQLELEELEFTPSEDRMFAALRYLGKVKGSDKVIDGHFFSVIGLRRGRFWRGEEYRERAEARAAFEWHE